MTEPSSALAKLREPFAPNQISKLPKESRKQIEERKNRVPNCMIWDCPECGNAHHKGAVHLDYVGHAAATDRLLDADERWGWEPVADPASLGLPMVPGGMWIKLTVDGHSRYGFGCADGKTGGDAIKEIIGDAIRNAGMRFGMALDLWHKGDLHGDDEASAEPQAKKQEGPERVTPEQELMLDDKMREAGVDPVKFLRGGAGVSKSSELPAEKFPESMKALSDILAKANQQPRPRNPQHSAELDDEIPY